MTRRRPLFLAGALAAVLLSGPGARAADGVAGADSVEEGATATGTKAPAAARAEAPAAGTGSTAARTRAPAAKPAATGAKAVPPGGAAGPRDRGGKVMDRLELDPTAITGNRELPKVMVIVPWKKSDIGDLVGKPVNSLIDEALQPVDREVFRREIDYYGALGPDRPRPETPVTVEGGRAAPEK